MTFTVFADTSKVCAEMSWNAVAVTVCLHFDKANPSPTDFANLSAEVAKQWALQLLPRQTSELILGDVVAFDLSSEGAPKFVNSDENGSPGTNGVDSLPNNVAALISHRTIFTGRSARGRSYFPGMSAGQELAGLLTVAARDVTLAAWGTFITAIQAAVGWQFVIAQRFSNGVQLTTGVTRDVTSEILKLEFGTQRRRQVPSAT